MAKHDQNDPPGALPSIRLYTMREAAEHVGIGYWGFRDEVLAGRVPHVCVGSGGTRISRRFTAAHLAQYIAEQTVRSEQAVRSAPAAQPPAGVRRSRPVAGSSARAVVKGMSADRANTDRQGA